MQKEQNEQKANESEELERPASGKNESADSTSKAAEGSAPKARKRLWTIAILLCIVAAVAGIYLTYSAFLAGDFLKSVAVSGTSQALFASDMLTGYSTDALPADDKIAVRSVIVDDSSDTCSFTFRVYNYLLGDTSKVNDKDVNATIDIAATNATYWDWSVIRSPALGGAGNKDKGLTFRAYTPTMYTYTVRFKTTDLNKASFTVKVQVGENSPGTTLKWLAAKIAPSERAKVTSSGVTGEWVDGNSDINSFDAYNYRVTVTGAKTKVKLTWPKEKLELDPHFAAAHNVSLDTGSVEFEMDPGSQVITFYQASDDKPSSWPDISVSYGAA